MHTLKPRKLRSLIYKGNGLKIRKTLFFQQFVCVIIYFEPKTNT